MAAREPPSGATRILILMSDTGGGHRAGAEALRAAFAERYADLYRVDMVDLWMKHTPWPLNQIPKSYRFLTNETPWLYKMLYEIGENPEATEPLMRAAYRIAKRRISALINQYEPHLIISVHPLLQEVPLKILARMRRRIPFVTVLLELSSAHKTWLQKNVALCFVANYDIYRMALQGGMKPSQLRQSGFPIRPIFGRPPRPKEELRRELGLQVDVPVALLLGGGEGIGPVGEIARAVAARLGAESRKAGKSVGQLVVICGRNSKLREELEAHAWPIPTVVQGFVTNMVDWMGVSDCVITKSGSNTIAEALALGLPLLLSGFIVGQEEPNVPYVVNNGAGVFCDDPEQIAEIISRWFGPDRATLARLAQGARRLGRPHAAYQIVEEIHKFMSDLNNAEHNEAPVDESTGKN